MCFTTLSPRINIFCLSTDDVGVEMCDDVRSVCEFSVDGGAINYPLTNFLLTIRLYVVVAADCFSMIICHYEKDNVARYMLSMTVIAKTYIGIFLLG